MNKIICGSEDSSRVGMELWHIQRARLGFPLCRARLSGRIRTTKGNTRCSDCSNLDQPVRLAHQYPGAALALLMTHRGQRVPAPEVVTRAILHAGYNRDLHGRLPPIVASTLEAILERDYAYVDHDKLVLTGRGRVVAADLARPARALGKDKLVHGRRALSEYTICRIQVLPGSYETSELEDLRKREGDRLASHGRFTCLRCMARWQGATTWFM